MADHITRSNSELRRAGLSQLQSRGSFRLQYASACNAGVCVLRDAGAATKHQVVDTRAPSLVRALESIISKENVSASERAAKYDFSVETTAKRLIEERRSDAANRARMRGLAQHAQQRLKDEQKLLEARRIDREREEQALREAEDKRKLENERRLAEKQQLLSKQLLTSGEQKMMDDFQSISGSRDFIVCKGFLDRFQWDLSIAVGHFFEYGGDLSAVPESPSHSGGQSSGRAANPSCVITFVFPDQSSEDASFKAEDTLWILFEWVYGKASRWGGTAFNMGTRANGSVETKLFTEADYDQSLQDLGMMPRGTIYIGKA